MKLSQMILKEEVNALARELSENYKLKKDISKLQEQITELIFSVATLYSYKEKKWRNL